MPDSTMPTLRSKDFRVSHFRATRKHTFRFVSLGEKHLQSEGVAEVCNIILEKEQNRDQIPGQENSPLALQGAQRAGRKEPTVEKR